MKNRFILLAAMGLLVGVSVTTPTFTRAADDAAATTAPATQAADGTKFYGAVTAVDTTANTFTVGDQTFAVTGSSKMTKADDSTATLADAVVGQPARGTYNKNADGKLEVAKVRFGKKAGGKGGGKGGGKKKTPDPATTQAQ